MHIYFIDAIDAQGFLGFSSFNLESHRFADCSLKLAHVVPESMIASKRLDPGEFVEGSAILIGRTAT